MNCENLITALLVEQRGLIDNNTLAVNGDINSHPDSEQIKVFCHKYNVDIIPLKDGKLVDIGTIIVNI